MEFTIKNGWLTVIAERNYGARWGFFHNCGKSIHDIRDRLTVGVAYAELHLGPIWFAVSHKIAA